MLKPAAVGEKMFELCLHRDWRPDRYDVIGRFWGEPDTIQEHLQRERWFKQATRVGKQCGRDAGIVFGFDPDCYKWRVSPTDRPDITRRILEYGFASARDSVNQVVDQLIAAHAMGHVFNGHDVLRSVSSVKGTLDSLFGDIVFAAVEDD